MNVFVVDDDSGTLNALQIGLMSRGFRVEVAENGNRALALVKETLIDPVRKPDVLLTDLKMPGINGLELIRRVRELLPGLPCILMTAYGNDTVFKQAASIRGCSTLDKPFRAESLIRRITEMVERPESINDGR